MKSTTRWLIVPAVAAIVVLAMAVSPSLAVGVHAHSHAHDQGGVRTTIDNDFGLFSASANAPSTTFGAHAHAWGRARVKFFGTRKRVGGHHWFTDARWPKHAWWHAWASTGEFILKGPEGFAELRFIVPASANLPPFEDDPGDPIDPDVPIGPHPINGMMADSFFDVFFDVDVEVIQDRQAQKVLQGQARLGGPQNPNPGLSASGDLADYLREQKVSDTRTAVDVAAPVLRSVRVEANKPFEAMFDLRTYSGVPPDDLTDFHMHDDPPLIDGEGDEIIGAAAGYVVDMMVARPDTYRLIAVPEPGTWALLATGLVAVGLVGWRGRRRRRG